MSFVTLGKGPRAVRVQFHSDSVELRFDSSVINGNDDMRRALRWVLDHPSSPAEAIPELQTTADEVCRLLTQLVPHGIPLRAWGPSWASRCVCHVEVENED